MISQSYKNGVDVIKRPSYKISSLCYAGGIMSQSYGLNVIIMGVGDSQCFPGIAIIEDEKDIVSLYEALLKSRGYKVNFVAYDGPEGVKKFVESNPKPSVVLMDYRLPSMNGVESTKEILKIEPTTKIIFISADEQAEKDALAAGAFTFIKKPARAREMIDAVKNAC